MITNQTYQNIRDLLAEGKIEQAMDQLKEVAIFRPSSDDLVSLNAQFAQLKGKARTGELTAEAEMAFHNRLVVRLLDLVNELQEVARQDELIQHQEQVGEVEKLNELLECLDMSYQAYKTQNRLSKKLRVQVEKRLDIQKRVDIESFFTRYFHKLLEDEKRLHRTIRSYTEQILSNFNLEALEILQTAGKQFDWEQKIPLVEDLKEHLIFWKVKFENSFLETPSMCLVYLLVEEGKGFPKGVEDAIKGYLEKLKSA
jgi:hypothetical protein